MVADNLRIGRISELVIEDGFLQLQLCGSLDPYIRSVYRHGRGVWPYVRRLQRQPADVECTSKLSAAVGVCSVLLRSPSRWAAYPFDVSFRWICRRGELPGQDPLD